VAVTTALPQYKKAALVVFAYPDWKLLLLLQNISVYELVAPSRWDMALMVRGCACVDDAAI
jgi:hypothetical protein